MIFIATITVNNTSIGTVIYTRVLCYGDDGSLLLAYLRDSRFLSWNCKLPLCLECRRRLSDLGLTC